MRHAELWRALDTLAAEKGLSPSGLARAAGLDPTSFNRSKRGGSGVPPRWPGTESLARVLLATGTSLERFATLVAGARVLARETATPDRSLPLLLFSRLPAGPDEAGMAAPSTVAPFAAGEPDRYAVRLDTDRFEPALREGGLLLVSPAAAIGLGDRVLRIAPDAVTIGLVREPGARGGALLQRLDGGGTAAADGARLHRIDWAEL